MFFAKLKQLNVFPNLLITAKHIRTLAHLIPLVDRIKEKNFSGVPPKWIKMIKWSIGECVIWAHVSLILAVCLQMQKHYSWYVQTFCHFYNSSISLFSRGLSKSNIHKWQNVRLCWTLNLLKDDVESRFFFLFSRVSSCTSLGKKGFHFKV